MNSAPETPLICGEDRWRAVPRGSRPTGRVAEQTWLPPWREQTRLARWHRDSAVQRVPELPAGGDAELREHLAQMPFDRPRAQEQRRADLGIGLPVTGPAAFAIAPASGNKQFDGFAESWHSGADG